MGEEFRLRTPGSSSEGSDEMRDTLIPDQEIIRASVMEIKTQPKPYKDDNGEPVKKVVFRFKVTEPEFFGKSVWGETSTSFVDHENCKLRNWVGELLGVVDLPDGFTFNTDDLLDAECRLLVEVYSFKKDGKTEYRNRVVDVLRAEVTAGAGVGDEPF